MYKSILRPLLFRKDAEEAHHKAFRMLRRTLSLPLGPALLRSLFRFQNKSLEREVFGLKFPNPVGLAAGFDKEGILLEKWENMGFGFIEIGTVTPRPQAGNPKPRLFRLPADKAILNRMGFNSEGLRPMVERLKKMGPRNIIIAGNIGKNKDTPNENAAADYLACFDALFPYVDYFVVNVSSPNTPNLRALQDKEPLTALLQAIQTQNQGKPHPKPILLKIAPDLTNGQLDDIVEIAAATGLAGLVATNTTISREGLQTPASEVEALGPGGISGAPLKKRSLEVLTYLRNKTNGTLPVISVGGIGSTEDAKERLAAGAALIQIYSGYIYEGPSFPKKICRAISSSPRRND